MNDQQLFETIISTTFTKTAYLRRLDKLRVYLEKKFFTDKTPSLSAFLNDQNISLIDRKIISGWGEMFFNSFQQSNFYKILKSLTDKLKTIKVVTVFLPMEPGDDEADNLGAWFRDNFKKKMLIDICEDPKMVAGCAYVVDGIYHDFSLKYLLFKKRSQISKVVDTYAHAQ